MSNYMPRDWNYKTLEQKIELLECHRLIYMDALNYKGVYGKEPNRHEIIEQWETMDSLEYKKLKEEQSIKDIQDDFR